MAKSKTKYVQYLIAFNDPIPWTSLNDFERDLAIFFSSYGVEAELQSLMEGYAGTRVITLTRLEVLDPNQQMTAPSEIRPMKDQFKNLKAPTGRKVKK